ncbi:MAG TPA: alpha/beta hydrolase [Nitrospiria bacterium]|nr:alpha/beta hydrolase [Nitrospiria bacterium]HUK55079.1 alpha/beta hydrolase [Nitrospiria bacterium]
MNLEKAVTFRNNKGQLLFGILHLPESPKLKSRIGINILNPGLKNRVAPNRINVKMARMFCDMGFHVLRVDPFGIGDSEGELAAHESVMDLWGMIQRGLFVPDTLAANDFFVREARLEKLILIGQCGAAVTGMLVGGKDDRVESLILVDSPVRLLSSQVDMSDILAEISRPGEMMLYYLRKVFSGRSWLNLIRFQSDFGGLRKLFARMTHPRSSRNQGNASDAPGVSERFNKKFLDAFRRFTDRNKNVYFLFAANDFSLQEFRQDMQAHFLDRHPEYRSRCRIDIIDDANHVYTEEKWQHELLHYMKSWLERYRQAC